MTIEALKKYHRRKPKGSYFDDLPHLPGGSGFLRSLVGSQFISEQELVG